MKTNCIPSILRSALSAAVLAVLCLAAVTAQRLPTNVVPTHYTLTLAPDLKTATFTGVEKIEVNINEPTTTITLNSAEIKFQSVTIVANGLRLIGAVSLDPDKEQVTFTFPKELAAGSAVLEIHYSGILNNELRGFYLSHGKNRNYAVTQFEPTDARRAYPSFDEPAFKARFLVSLIVDQGDTAISNGQIVADTPGPGEGKHTLEFSETPKMSTYLVAFLVGDFQCTAGTSDGVVIRACSTPDKVEYTSYALGVAKYVLHYYNSYFGIPYPLKKLDLISIPDFEAGAMENFGAITYRETDMLLDEKTASIRAKRNVALVVAHEMAHQWFGDLVTMDWWNNIWLNEGFATWMENKPVAAMHPEWKIAEMVAANAQGTMNLDAQPTTRPIRAPLANTPAEINQLFDGISYGKASDVLLTVENYLGEETFRRGVHAYLAAHAFGNATAEDFWNTQTATSHKPVDQIMESLVVQPGVPILTFGEPSDGQVNIGQKRFFLSPGDHPDADQKWTLPVCFAMENGAQQCELLTPSSAAVKAPATPVFFADALGKGYYRSAYAPAQYKALVAGVETKLTPPERISLEGDQWAQVSANKTPVGDYLDLLTALKGDSSAQVIGGVMSGIATVYNSVASTPEEREQISAWVRRTFAPEYARLGVPSPSDSPNTRELRANLFALLGNYGKDAAILAQASELADKYLAYPASVDSTLAQTALTVAARNGTAGLFDKLQQESESASNPEQQVTALRLLAVFENPELEQRSLDYDISGKVRNQDAAIQLGHALQIAETREAAWQFVKSHWDQVHALLTPEMGQILVSSTGSFCSAEARDDVESFFSTHKVEAADVSLKHAIEHINGCIELRSLQGQNLKQWLGNDGVKE
jgi:aminopeptidase N